MKISTKSLKPIVKALGKAMGKCRKHAPEILLGVGTVAFGGTVVAACKATTKIDAVVTPAKEELNNIHRDETLAPKDVKKQTFKVYSDAAAGMIKLYGPAIGLGLLSLSSFGGAYGIMKKRHAAALAAYSLLEKSFNEYRERTRKLLGDDDKLVTGETKQKVDTTETDPETGKEKTVKKSFLVTDPNLASPYAFYFDHTTTKAACEDEDYDRFYLDGIRTRIEDHLERSPNDYLFMSYLLDLIDYKDPDPERDRELKTAAQFVGWTKSGGDLGTIDLGVQPVKRLLPDGTLINSIVVNPNVEGNIMGKL